MGNEQAVAHSSTDDTGMQTHHLLLQLFWLPEADNVIQRFARCWDFHQADGALTPLVTRFHPQTWAFVIPAHNVLIMGEVTIQLQ